MDSFGSGRQLDSRTTSPLVAVTSPSHELGFSSVTPNVTKTAPASSCTAAEELCPGRCQAEDATSTATTPPVTKTRFMTNQRISKTVTGATALACDCLKRGQEDVNSENWK